MAKNDQCVCCGALGHNSSQCPWKDKTVALTLTVEEAKKVNIALLIHSIEQMKLAEQIRKSSFDEASVNKVTRIKADCDKLSSVCGKIDKALNTVV